MSKFKVKLKIQGFELEVEGSRDEVPHIANSLGQQVIGMLQPAAAIVSGMSEDAGEAVELVEAPVVPQQQIPTNMGKLTSRRASAKNGERARTSKALDWVHQPGAWGVPRQSWPSLSKAIWLLYVAHKEVGAQELSDREIYSTFNKHFKQAGALDRRNLSRELGKAKINGEKWVGENTVERPRKWYLTESGLKEAERLVAEARSPN